MMFAVNRYQRIVVIVCLIAVSYCCVWIPWCLNLHSASDYSRIGYGWVWAGPRYLPGFSFSTSTSGSGNSKDFPDIDEILDQPQHEYERISPSAMPDMPIIALRVTAATAVAAAAFLLTGMKVNAKVAS